MTKTARFAIRLPNAGPLASPESITRIALEAEYLGFDGVVVQDHVYYDARSKYHFNIGTAEKVDEVETKLGMPMNDFYESVTLLSYVAGMTKRIKLLPSTWVLPWRNPILIAKQAITLHELSAGRLIFCVGIGAREEDFAAMNVPFKTRGRMMNEHLETVKRIFAGEPNFSPKPRNLPIWIAGTAIAAVYERIAKYGDGWLISWRTSVTPDGCRKELPMLNSHMQKYNRNVSELEIGRLTFLCVGKTNAEARRNAEYTVQSFHHGKGEEIVQKTYATSFIGTPDDIIKITQEYLDAGVSVHDMKLIAPSIEAAIIMMKIFSKEVIPSFR
jgi:alkanesulfonate monooxygenase SsuD/methylene tetrahydromethanopterin reductase-like flavin-dependent oxidoreductase (luciferase family)